VALALRHPRLSAVRNAAGRFARAGAGMAAAALLWLAAPPWPAFVELATRPGLLRSVMLSLWSGLAATAIAYALTVAILALLHGGGMERRLAALLVPLLSVPHAAFAVGFAFLIAPSGWMVRLAAPAFGLGRPPDWPVPGDPLALSLICGLVLREFPFLLLVALAAKARIGVEPLVASARTLGCSRIEAFLWAALPQIRLRMRVPLLAVLVYGVANADMAAVLGPDLPAPLAVRMVRWFFDPDPAGMALAAAAVPLAALTVVAAILLWRPLEELLTAAALAAGRAVALPGRLGLGLFALAGSASLIALVLWALAGPWPFPQLLPAALSASTLQLAAADLGATVRTTLLLALVVALVAVAGARLLLRPGTADPPGPPMALLPLFLPAVVVAPLLQRMALALGVDGTATAVAAGHLLYALPYALLVLEGPVRRLSPRLLAAGRSLGATPARLWWRVELPLLAPAYGAAFATALSVSFAQYETTLFLGGGRVRTLTTETLAYMAVGDRRLAACAGLLAALPPLFGFAAAALVVRRGLTWAAARTAPRCPPR